MIPIQGKTKVVAIFGDPLTYTLSPVFQNAGFQALNLPFVYVPFPVTVADFPGLIQGLKSAKNFLGANVTNPHKQAALKLVDTLSPAARAIGAVNTIFRRGTKWVGDNTDWRGFLEAARKHSRQPLRGSRVLLLGAGGAGRAVAFACRKSSVAGLVVADIRDSQSRSLCRDLKGGFDFISWNDRQLVKALNRCDWVVNTVPDPVFSDKLASWLKTHSRPLTLFDITYDSSKLKLLQVCRKKGFTLISGIPMLFEQGLGSFSLWTSRKAPRFPMWKSLQNAIKSRNVR